MNIRTELTQRNTTRKHFVISTQLNGLTDSHPTAPSYIYIPACALVCTPRHPLTSPESSPLTPSGSLRRSLCTTACVKAIVVHRSCSGVGGLEGRSLEHRKQKKFEKKEKKATLSPQLRRPCRVVLFDVKPSNTWRREVCSRDVKATLWYQVIRITALPSLILERTGLLY